MFRYPLMVLKVTGIERNKSNQKWTLKQGVQTASKLRKDSSEGLWGEQILLALQNLVCAPAAEFIPPG